MNTTFLARKLRRQQTPWEARLWGLLRDRKFQGYKFRRQHKIGKYIVDFYCAERKLIIELDGGHHTETCKTVHDKERQKYLESQGYRVLRFWNNELDQNPYGLQSAIYEFLLTLNPSPLRGEGKRQNKVMSFPSLKKAKLKDKTVLLRADFDVPLKTIEKGVYEVEDDYRMQRGLPTIRHLIRNEAKTIIVAHLGRPKKPSEEFSLKPVAEHLAEMLKFKFMEISENDARLPNYQLPHVFFFKEDFRKSRIKEMLKDLNPQDIAVLENIRFYPEENQNSADFGKDLAALADVYVNDAFASSYDERASVTAAAPLLPHFPGFELESEIIALSRVLDRPKRPVIVVAGGIKFSDKLSGLRGLMEVCDKALVGGGLASLFLVAHGYQVGKSMIDEESLPGIKELLRNYKQKIQLPKDVVVARSPEKTDTVRVTTPDKIEPGEMILDIGPQTIHSFSETIKSAKTLVWSGPMGKFEVNAFSHGTKALGRLIASRCKGKAFGVAGGGNTLDAIKMIKLGDYIDYLSTGGTAMLDFLSGKPLPGIAALED